LETNAEPVPVYRLLSVAEVEVPGPSVASPFVGRAPELAALRESWERVLAERRCELVTVVGEAGIGKSRLVAEALASLEAPVVQSRCLSYGDGITYWPVVEVVRQLDAKPSDPFAAAVIRSLLGETDQGTSAEEIIWAFGKLLAQKTPLVVVFDDVHRGEEAFLDLAEAIPLLSGEAPLLVLCLARPELLTKRPDWPVTLRLDPLSDEQVTELVGDRVSSEVRERITHAAGGNPLFVVELLAMAEQSAEVEVPASLQALLAARLDQLDEPERQVLEHAAVEGEVFHRGAAQALTPDEPQLTRRLATLARRGLIRPDKAQIAGEDAFRFSHLLFRDAAYDEIPKAVRAELHERFAGWLGARGGLVELDELVGYHLEQAVRYRGELGLPIASELIETARRHLIAAGRTAFTHEDHVAAISWLERAIALRPEPPDVGLELGRLQSLDRVGRFVDAHADAEALAERAAMVGDTVGELAARVKARTYRVHIDPERHETVIDELATLLDHALPRLEAAADEGLLCHAYAALGEVFNVRARYDQAAAVYERAAACAAHAGLPYAFLSHRSVFRLWGTLPVTRWLAWYEEQENKQDIGIRTHHAQALALLGRLDRARAEIADVQADLADRGSEFLQAEIGVEIFKVERFGGGDPERALEAARTAYEGLAPLGETFLLPEVCGDLAWGCLETGRLDEVDIWVERSAALVPRDLNNDWRSQRAKLLAYRGDHVSAERLAREAVAVADKAEAPTIQGYAYADLAEVLTLAGKSEQARVALEEALTRYARKEAVVLARQVRDRLATLDQGHVTRQPVTVET
jgi:tetratricopeptide (TPR) repeat protein